MTITADQTLYAHWTANTNTAYKVQHWQQNLGADSTNYTLKDTDNLTGTTASKVTPSRKSYSGFTAPAGTEITIAADGSTVLNYYYTRNSYTVTLEKGTGISSVSGAATYQYGANVTINATPASGYSWSKWTGTHSTTDKQYTFTMPASNVTDTANATLITYNITYDLAGGSVATANPTTYNVTTNTFTLNNPTKAGYTFAGWTGTGLNSASTSVSIAKDSTGNRSYTATWTPNNYTYDVVYKSESGITLGTDTVSFAFGTTNSISPIAYAGYNTPSAQSVKWDSTDRKTITFTYTLITYSIGYTMNGGAASNPATYTVESAAITLNAPTRTGYTFTGWTGSNGSTAQTTVTINKGTTGDLTYTANWSENSYAVQFNANTGTGSMGNMSFTYTESKALTSNTFTKNGYTFTGWNTLANGSGTAYDDMAAVSKLTDADNGTVTLYAQWSLNRYTITLNSNGGSVDPTSISYDVTAGFTLPTPTKPGYKFTGWQVTVANGNWNLDSTIGAGSVAAGQYGNVTLTARWEMSSSDFTINIAGLTNGQSAVIKISGERTDGVEFADFSFVVVGNGGTVITKLAGLPVGTYTISVEGGWTWRYDHTTETVNTATTGSVTITFTANGNVQWLNAYGQQIK